MLITISTTGNSPYSTAIVKNPLCEVVISSYWESEKSEVIESNCPLFATNLPDLRLWPPR